MKKLARFCSALVLLGFILLYTTGCSVDVSDYHAVSYNIVWNECDKEIHTDYLPLRVYYSIVDVPSDEYLACKYRENGVGATSHPVLMKRHDAESSLKLDTASAKLILSHPDVNFSDEDWMSYGQKIKKQEIASVDSAIAEKLVQSITADTPDYVDVQKLEDWYDSFSYLYDGDGDALRLQFSLEEYDGLTWIAFLVKYGDGYYVEVKKDLYNSQYLICCDELTPVIEKAIDEYDLKIKK